MKRNDAFGGCIGHDRFDAHCHTCLLATVQKLVDMLDEQTDHGGGLPAPINPAVSVASIDEARIEMVHDLHRVVKGYTGARPETPQQVWAMLLDEVARRFR